MSARARVLSWLAVALVGAVVVALVLGLSLFPRLHAAQSLIDEAKPAFAADRITGDKAAIGMVDTAVTVVDQAATPSGAASEVPKLIAFVAKGSGLSPAQVRAALQKNFPHTTGLLLAMPLTAVSAELPRLVPFLASTLKLPPAQVTAVLQRDYPHLYQSITNLPAVTAAWGNVPGTSQLSRFDGTAVRTVPQTVAYFQGDVIPMLDRQQGNYRSLASKGGVGFLSWLLLVVGLVVLVFGLLMAYLVSRGGSAAIEAAAWGVVVAVGAVVIVLVLGLSLFPRLSNGQDLLDNARPAFTAQRVEGSRAAITTLSQVVQTADPIATQQGGVAAEVPKLVTFVSRQTHLTPPQVLAALRAQLPHTTALLQAVPLSAVSAELPRLIGFLSTALKLPPAQVQAAIARNFPHLDVAIEKLPAVTSGWNNVPGVSGLTRFDGTPVRTVPAIRDYFSQDVIPVLEHQQANFQTVDTTWPRLTVFPPLLLVVGILVVLYGLVMLYLTLRGRPAAAPAAPTPSRRPSPTRSRV